MKYKNIKTGAVIETTTEVHGKDWQALMPVKNSVPEVEEVPEAEEVPEVEEAPEAEEVPEMEEAEEAEVASVQQAKKKGGRKR